MNEHEFNKHLREDQKRCQECNSLAPQYCQHEFDRNFHRVRNLLARDISSNLDMALKNMVFCDYCKNLLDRSADAFHLVSGKTQCQECYTKGAK